jgi:hypothetical protein
MLQLTLAAATLLGGGMEVEVLLNGGVPNPSLRLNASEAASVCEAAKTHKASRPICRKLGFTGWSLPCAGGAATPVRGMGAVDAILSKSSDFLALSAEVRSHVLAEAISYYAAKRGNSECGSTAAVSSSMLLDKNGDDCDASPASPIRGSDNASSVHYDPQTDDRGCFVTKQSYNNCYNYGSDVLTNSFGQPGRGSGVCSHTTRPCVPNTCDDVKSGAISDGLAWVGTDLPTVLPEAGHYVSLHIWPASNFHWIRMDANKLWSHKPGGSPVRNTDNDGNLISDPAKANFAPWTTHCGYMLVKPSNASIY